MVDTPAKKKKKKEMKQKQNNKITWESKALLLSSCRYSWNLDRTLLELTVSLSLSLFGRGGGPFEFPFFFQVSPPLPLLVLLSKQNFSPSFLPKKICPRPISSRQKWVWKRVCLLLLHTANTSSTVNLISQLLLLVLRLFIKAKIF